MSESFEAWNAKTFKDLKSIKRLVEDRHYYTSLEYCFNEKQKEIQSLKEKLKEAEKELEGARELIEGVKDCIKCSDSNICNLSIDNWLTQNNQTKGEE